MSASLKCSSIKKKKKSSNILLQSLQKINFEILFKFYFTIILSERISCLQGKCFLNLQIKCPKISIEFFFNKLKFLRLHQVHYMLESDT